MTALLSLLARAILVALAVWLLGGLMLRIAVAMLAIGGLLRTASTGSPTMAGAAILGAAIAWLAGHWLYALRHHHVRSPLARHIFLQALPSRLDPTRRWGVPNLPSGARHP